MQTELSDGVAVMVGNNDRIQGIINQLEESCRAVEVSMCVLSTAITVFFCVCVEHFIISFSYFLHYGLSNDISACVIVYRRMVVGRSLVYVSGLIVCTLFWKNAEENLH